MKKCSLVAVLVLLLLSAAVPAHAITRDRVMARARTFAEHLWRCTSANQTASCSASYRSPYPVGDYMGLPYDWGGYVDLYEFDRNIADGYGAGTEPYGDILDCTTGLDCSGYVSKCWDTGHYSTSTIPAICTEISASSVQAGDVFDYPGYHVVLYSRTLPDGTPEFYESAGIVHRNVYGGWAHVSGYTPLRYNDIEGTSSGNPAGTFSNPIVIDHFIYSDSRDTSGAPSDMVDICGAAPSADESGPEVVYQVTLTQPGSLTVSVEDGSSVDIDVHLYTSSNTSDCAARNDSVFTYAVDCGTYFIVADTFVSSGVPLAGPYTLTVDFAPSGGACGSGPPGYDPLGGPGDSCAYPGHEDLPMCNPNTGAHVCLYNDSPPEFSFCSHACASDADCADFAGGCCGDIGGGQLYCFTADFCDGPPTDDPVIPDAMTDADVVVVPDGVDMTVDPADDGPVGDSVPPDVPADQPLADSDEPPDDGSTADDGGQDDGGGGCSCAVTN
jgi:hypothetical protein